MLAVELVEPGTTTPNAAVAAAVNAACHAEGADVDLRHLRQRVPLPTPLVIEDALLEEALAVLDKAFAGVA